MSVNVLPNEAPCVLNFIVLRAYFHSVVFRPETLIAREQLEEATNDCDGNIGPDDQQQQQQLQQHQNEETEVDIEPETIIGATQAFFSTVVEEVCMHYCCG